MIEVTARFTDVRPILGVAWWFYVLYEAFISGNFFTADPILYHPAGQVISNCRGSSRLGPKVPLAKAKERLSTSKTLRNTTR